MRTKHVIVGFVLFIGFSMSAVRGAYGGCGYDVRCSDGECGFRVNAAIGGGIRYEEAGGFCAKCGKWVKVTWPRRGEAPAPLAAFWDPQTGGRREARGCPQCREPYIVIRRIEEMKYCPQCKQATLVSKRTMLYD